MNKKKKILILLVILALIGAGWYFYTHRRVKINELTLFGNVEIRQVDLSFQVSGKIEKLLKEEGDAVKAGELVALMDARDYQANFEKSIAEAERTKAISANAASQYQRQAPLCVDDTVSQQECDNLFNAKNE